MCLKSVFPDTATVGQATTLGFRDSGYCSIQYKGVDGIRESESCRVPHEITSLGPFLMLNEKTML